MGSLPFVEWFVGDVAEEHEEFSRIKLAKSICFHLRLEIFGVQLESFSLATENINHIFYCNIG